MMRLRDWPAALALMTCCAAAPAVEVIVEGAAAIRDDDLAGARDQAARRALARAVERHNARISTQTLVLPGAAIDAVQVSATACAEESEVLGEHRTGNELTVTLRVRVADGSCEREQPPVCRIAWTNRLAVTGFAMEFPEQKLPDEPHSLSRLTAIETARKIVRRGGLLADFDENAFPYRTPAHAPIPLMNKADGDTPFAAIARRLRAQYVLAGIYRDFGLSTDAFGWKNSRRIEIEAFLHDGASGNLLARRIFTAEAHGDVRLTAKPAIGSPAFYRTDLGRAWGDLLDRLAAWAESEAACLPFVARVLKTEGRLIWIDAGAESRLSAGDSLTLHSWSEPPVRSVSGVALGREKRPLASATIRHIYPAFAVLDLIDAPQRLEINQGDVLYAQ